ncbi:MAG: hypothetical protein AAB391_02145 [Patescibacteria group bacterium]
MSAKKHIAHADTAAAKGRLTTHRRHWRIVTGILALTAEAAPARSVEKKTSHPDEHRHKDPFFGGFGQALKACAQLGLG